MRIASHPKVEWWISGWNEMEGWTKLLGFQVFNICKDHWTLQWKGLNLSSSVWVLKIASFEGSGYLGIDKTLGKPLVARILMVTNIWAILPDEMRWYTFSSKYRNSAVLSNATWNPKHPVFNGCFVISTHFPSKGLESSNCNNHKNLVV